MSRTDDLEVVVRLATLTEDRDPAEQRALIAVAASVENDLNTATTRNLRARWGRPASELVDLVVATYAPSEGRPVAVPKAVREKLDRRRRRWTEAQASGWNPS